MKQKAQSEQAAHAHIHHHSANRSHTGLSFSRKVTFIILRRILYVNKSFAIYHAKVPGFLREWENLRANKSFLKYLLTNAIPCAILLFVGYRDRQNMGV